MLRKLSEMSEDCRRGWGLGWWDYGAAAIPSLMHSIGLVILGDGWRVLVPGGWLSRKPRPPGAGTNNQIATISRRAPNKNERRERARPLDDQTTPCIVRICFVPSRHTPSLSVPLALRPPVRSSRCRLRVCRIDFCRLTLAPRRKDFAAHEGKKSGE